MKGRQHYDEKYVKVDGKDCYDLNCTDHVTKYQTAHLFVEERTKKRCEEFLKQVKDSCYDQILARYKKEKHKPVKNESFSHLYLMDLKIIKRHGVNCFIA